MKNLIKAVSIALALVTSVSTSVKAEPYGIPVVSDEEATRQICQNPDDSRVCAERKEFNTQMQSFKTKIENSSNEFWIENTKEAIKLDKEYINKQLARYERTGNPRFMEDVRAASVLLATHEKELAELQGVVIGH